MDEGPKMERMAIGFPGKISVSIEFNRESRLSVKEYKCIRQYVNGILDSMLREIVEAAVIEHEEWRTNTLMKAAIPATMRCRLEREYARNSWNRPPDGREAGAAEESADD